MTNVFAGGLSRVSKGACVAMTVHGRLTQVREHAAEDGKRCRGLLVQLPKCRTGELLEVLGQLERGRGTD